MTLRATRTSLVILALLLAALGTAGTAEAANPSIVVGHTDAIHGFSGTAPLTLAGSFTDGRDLVGDRHGSARRLAVINSGQRRGALPDRRQR